MWLVYGVSDNELFTWEIFVCCLQRFVWERQFADMQSAGWQDILFCKGLSCIVSSNGGSWKFAVILIQPLTLCTLPPPPVRCVTMSPLLTPTLRALSSPNASPDYSMLAGDLFFHFLPAACAGYPFWSCIPWCDHSKLHGKFSFQYISSRITSPESFQHFIFSLVSEEGSVICSFIVSGSLNPEPGYSLTGLHGPFLFFVCLFLDCWICCPPLIPTFCFEEPIVFVSHLLASSSHVIAVVLLWPLVSLCLLVTVYVKCWRFSAKVFKILQPSCKGFASTNRRHKKCNILAWAMFVLSARASG